MRHHRAISVPSESKVEVPTQDPPAFLDAAIVRWRAIVIPVQVSQRQPGDLEVASCQDSMFAQSLLYFDVSDLRCIRWNEVRTGSDSIDLVDRSIDFDLLGSLVSPDRFLYFL